MGKFLKIMGAIVLVVVLAVVGMLAWAFAGQTDYQATGAVGDLEVAFADPEWGGEALPEGMWCDRYEGSNAMSPSLLVAGVPTDANAIIVNFNDEMVFSWMKAVVTGRSDFGSNRQRRSGCRPSHQIRASWAPKFLSNTAHLFRSV